VKYHFQVIERVQYVVRDPRSMVLLKFEFDEVEQVRRGRRAQPAIADVPFEPEQ